MADNEKTQQNLSDEPAKIVQIAYHQMSEMLGMEDPTMKVTNTEVADNSGTFVVTRRLLQMPIFTTVTTTVSNMYNTVKQSNDIVNNILITTEEGLEQGAKLVEPVTQKIGSTLEVPLKCVDNILCQGLDYLDNKVPTIKETSGVFLTNIGNFFRSSLETLSNFYLNAVKRIQSLSKPLSIEDSQNAQNDKKEATK